MTKKKKIIIIVTVAALVLVAVIVTATIWDNSLKRADYAFGGYEIDGVEYTSMGFRWQEEIGDYKETGNIVCKTTDGTWTFYEIDKFPNREYLVARCFYNAEVIKRKGEPKWT